MSSRVEAMAADNTPGTPHARTSVAAAELLEIPADMFGKFCWFQSTKGSGAAVDIGVRFGTSAAMGAVVLADRDGLATATLTADVNVPHLYLVASAAPTRIKLDPTWTHLSHIADGGATTGCLRFGEATGEG
jgi:hypothetical protein